MEKITKESFYRWKRDPVTKAIMETLQNLRTDINVMLTDGNLIMDSPKDLINLLGRRDGIDIILQMTFEEAVDEVDSSGIQDSN